MNESTPCLGVDVSERRLCDEPGERAAEFGGILEAVAQNYMPSDVPWGLRMLWHAGCAFGAVYCAFLQRLLRILPA